MDLLGPLPSAEPLFVLVDYYSRYYKVDILKSTTSEAVIRRLDAHLAHHVFHVGYDRTTGHSSCAASSQRTWWRWELSTVARLHFGPEPMAK